MANFSDVPQNIKEHLTSQRTLTIFQEITEKSEIYEVGILSDVVLRLITRNILPQDFSAKLAEEVGLKDKKAKVIARELKERILEPIRYALINWGVDINQIDVSEADTLDDFLKTKKEKEEKTNRLLASLGIETEVGDEEERDVDKTGKSEVISFATLGVAPLGNSVNIHPEEHRTDTGNAGNEAKPLIIHRENTTQTTKPSGGSKSFSMPFGFFKKTGQLGENPPSPVRARVETPKESKRTVHYSELRTPLSPFQNDGSFIDTGKSDFVAKKTEQSPIPIANTIIRKSEVTPPKDVDKKIPESPTIKTNEGVVSLNIPPKNSVSGEIPQKKESVPPQKITDEKPIEKKPWGFSLSGGLKKKDISGVSVFEKKQNKPSDLSSFFSGMKKDIESENKKMPETKPSNQNPQKQESGPHIEGNTVDLR